MHSLLIGILIVTTLKIIIQCFLTDAHVYLFQIVSPIAGYTYDYSTIRQKRSPNEDTKVR